MGGGGCHFHDSQTCERGGWLPATPLHRRVTACVHQLFMCHMWGLRLRCVCPVWSASGLRLVSSSSLVFRLPSTLRVMRWSLATFCIPSGTTAFCWCCDAFSRAPFAVTTARTHLASSHGACAGPPSLCPRSFSTSFVS